MTGCLGACWRLHPSSTSHRIVLMANNQTDYERAEKLRQQAIELKTQAEKLRLQSRELTKDAAKTLRRATKLAK